MISQGELPIPILSGIKINNSYILSGGGGENLKVYWII